MSTENRSGTTIIPNQPLWQKIESHLEGEKRRVFDEILSYPPPIPACDVQFNFLLAERAEITQELRRMHEILEKNPTDPDRVRFIREFIESCKYFDDLLEANLLSDLEKVAG